MRTFGPTFASFGPRPKGRRSKGNLVKAKSAIIVVSAFIVSTGVLSQEARREIQLMPVDGGELEYQVLGDGEPILVIHGGLIAGMPESFLTQPALSDWQLITYNRRGYAGSAPEAGPVDDYIERHAADAASLLEHLDVESAHVLGHSSGATISLQLAFDYPELVESLILLEPPMPATTPDADEEPSPMEQGMDQAMQAGNLARALDLFLERAGLPDWRAQYSEAVIQQVEASAPTFAEYEGPAIGLWEPPADPGSDVRRIRVLHLLGSRSHFTGEYVPVIRERFPRTESRVIQDASHGLHRDNPSATAEAIRSFLN